MKDMPREKKVTIALIALAIFGVLPLHFDSPALQMVFTTIQFWAIPALIAYVISRQKLSPTSGKYNLMTLVLCLPVIFLFIAYAGALMVPQQIASRWTTNGQRYEEGQAPQFGAAPISTTYQIWEILPGVYFRREVKPSEAR